MEKRVQRILAEAGIASRRKAEELIVEGRVTVNGKVAVLGTKADQSIDYIKLDGKLVSKPEPKVYYMFNKPKGVVTSLNDPEGRPTVRDYLKKIRMRVYPVGRLDYDSEGLLLLTNDGDFAQAILHPSKKIPKTYLAKVRGFIEEPAMEKLRKGVRLEDGRTAPAKVRLTRTLKTNSWIEITVTEGRKRQIRRMLERVGHPVNRLLRIKIGGLNLGDLKPGEFRPLSTEEIEKVKYEAGI